MFVVSEGFSLLRFRPTIYDAGQCKSLWRLTLMLLASSASSSERARVEMLGSFMVLSMSGSVFKMLFRPAVKPAVVFCSPKRRRISNVEGAKTIKRMNSSRGNQTCVPPCLHALLLPSRLTPASSRRRPVISLKPSKEASNGKFSMIWCWVSTSSRIACTVKRKQITRRKR